MTDGVRRVQIDTDTWIIMREFVFQPTAIVHRYTSWQGEQSRYLLLRWHADPAERRLVAICDTLDEADERVPPLGRPRTPLHPGATVPQWEEYRAGLEADKKLPFGR